MKRFLLLTLIVFSFYNTNAQMTTRVIADNLFIPWELIWGPDNHIWFTQKNGYICRLNPSTQKLDTIYHETNTVILNEGGMLGIVLHPDFSNNPYVYVAYNYNNNGYKERIVRYTYNGTNLGSPFTLIEGINGTSIHNGCRMIIVDNKLYITTGDAANQSISQNVAALNGKTLRLNLDGSIPNDNPNPSSAVWSWGHRNAQGLVYANNRIYSSEHGPQTDDELNILAKGRNFGWPTVRGYCNLASEMTFCNDSNVVEPIEAWTPTLAVSGIDYYNHPMFPQLQNSILMTTLKDRNLYQLKLNNTFDDVTSSSTISMVNGDRLRDVCIDPDGRIYISTSNSNASGSGAFVDKIIEIYDPSYSSISNLFKKGEKVISYPNPTNDIINIKAANNFKEYYYKITSIAGQLILDGTMKSTTTVSLNKLSAGIYVLTVLENDEAVYTHKFEKL